MSKFTQLWLVTARKSTHPSWRQNSKGKRSCLTAFSCLDLLRKIQFYFTFYQLENRNSLPMLSLEDLAFIFHFHALVWKIQLLLDLIYTSLHVFLGFPRRIPVTYNSSVSMLVKYVVFVLVLLLLGSVGFTKLARIDIDMSKYTGHRMGTSNRGQSLSNSNVSYI